MEMFNLSKFIIDSHAHIFPEKIAKKASVNIGKFYDLKMDFDGSVKKLLEIGEKNGIDKLKVVYSEEKPIRPLEDASISCRSHCICPPGTARKCTERRDIPGSVSFVPSVVGLIIAGEVIKDLIYFDKKER